MSNELFLQVRVIPRASRDEVRGWRQDALQIRLRAPPVEGQANEALRRFLAERLNVRLSDVEVVNGEKSRTKRLRIKGLTENVLRQRLGV